MNRQKMKLVVPAAALVALVAAGVWYETRRGDEEAPGTISGNGTVEATEVDVAARISGRLVSVVPREGEVVRAGQELAVLEASELEAQVAQARGNLAAAEAALADLAAGSRAEEIRRFKAQAQAAKDALAQAQARLDLLRAGTRAEQLEQARAAVRQAEAAFADADREAGRVGTLAEQGAVPGRDA
ncbi:MAG TPA: biotin/lipoyl-binding protein, partial [bacterium]